MGVSNPNIYHNTERSSAGYTAYQITSRWTLKKIVHCVTAYYGFPRQTEANAIPIKWHKVDEKPLKIVPTLLPM